MESMSQEKCDDENDINTAFLSSLLVLSSECSFSSERGSESEIEDGLDDEASETIASNDGNINPGLDSTSWERIFEVLRSKWDENDEVVDISMNNFDLELLEPRNGQVIIKPPPGFAAPGNTTRYITISEGSWECVKAINLTVKELREEGYTLKFFNTPEEKFMFWTEYDFSIVKECARLVPSLYPHISKCLLAECQNPTCSNARFEELEVEYENCLNRPKEVPWGEKKGPTVNEESKGESAQASKSPSPTTKPLLENPPAPSETETSPPALNFIYPVLEARKKFAQRRREKSKGKVATANGMKPSLPEQPGPNNESSQSETPGGVWPPLPLPEIKRPNWPTISKPPFPWQWYGPPMHPWGTMFCPSPFHPPVAGSEPQVPYVFNDTVGSTYYNRVSLNNGTGRTFAKRKSKSTKEATSAAK